MQSLNIHRNDTVKVITGSDRGKTGARAARIPDKGTVLVEHVRVVKKTVSSKPDSAPRAALPSRSRPSTFRTWCWSAPTAGRRAWDTRVEGDTRVRICKKCGQTLPTKK